MPLVTILEVVGITLVYLVVEVWAVQAAQIALVEVFALIIVAVVVLKKLDAGHKVVEEVEGAK